MKTYRDIHTGRLADKHTYIQTDIQKYRHTDRQAYRNAGHTDRTYTDGH